ncbi:MAG: hypothetical protein IJX36_09085, partial [Thermoguttaceae bacterium]|nr:hypothetical protein [Thermoguttaceae bacterium]
MKRGRSYDSSSENIAADALFDENAASAWGKTFGDEEIDETEDDASAEVGALSGRCDFTFLAKDNKPGDLSDEAKVGDSGVFAKPAKVGDSGVSAKPAKVGDSGVLTKPAKVGDLEDSSGLEEIGESARIWTPNELVDDILLSTVDGVGPLTAERLVEYFGSASEVLRASRRDLERVDKVGPKLERKISQAREACDVEALIRFCEENGIEIVAFRDARYPARLREIGNPPRLLYVRGSFAP